MYEWPKSPVLVVLVRLYWCVTILLVRHSINSDEKQLLLKNGSKCFGWDCRKEWNTRTQSQYIIFSFLSLEVSFGETLWCTRSSLTMSNNRNKQQIYRYDMNITTNSKRLNRYFGHTENIMNSHRIAEFCYKVFRMSQLACFTYYQFSTKKIRTDGARQLSKCLILLHCFQRCGCLIFYTNSLPNRVFDNDLFLILILNQLFSFNKYSQIFEHFVYRF